MRLLKILARVTMMGYSSSLLWWNYPLFFATVCVADFLAAFRILLLKSKYVVIGDNLSFKIVLYFKLVSLSLPINFQSICCLGSLCALNVDACIRNVNFMTT